MKEFLNKSDNNKVMVLDYLIRASREVPVTELVSETKLSNSTINHILYSFKENTYIKKDNLQLNYNEAGKLHSVRITDTSMIDASFFYLKKSLLFITIKELFEAGYINRVKICDKYFISSSTFSRVRQRLSEILESFDLELTRENTLEGEEYKIRNFYFLFFSNACSKWLFSKEAYSTLEASLKSDFLNSLNFDPSQKGLVRLFMHICNTRNAQKHYVSEVTSIEIKGKGKLQKIFLDIYQYLNSYFPYYENIVEEAKFIFVFCTRHQIIKIDLLIEDEITFDTKDINYFDYVKNYLVDAILVQFFDGDEQWHKMINFEITTFLLFAYTSFSDARRFLYIYDDDNYESKNNYEKQIYNRVIEILNNMEQDLLWGFFGIELNDFDKKGAMYNKLFVLVYSFLSKKEMNKVSREKVMIYVQNSRVYTGEIIKAKIKKMFSDKVELTSVYSTDVDLFITDKEYDNEISFPKTIYVTTFYDTQAMDRLFNEIFLEIIKQINNEHL
ncbi:helix-turn-helix domain-containing protein [Enterococcus quebecensis]|uniref:Mga helix-turn-helix domain-containing protein n=1 Tax=Enterococcus quebecensis TaxID=903983 RepID=A0A1E5GS62_9ENTE|nr:helix-turn-helix domain-containing protein [Enterococcus quebecensis]OEG15557.1 hypothetical protein BCR23_08820 [Enterococcus quebecensis]OJG74659.1 hypothetical protein RV12_GL002414 [Enterococcus quebecensis]